MIEPIFLQV